MASRRSAAWNSKAATFRLPRFPAAAFRQALSRLSQAVTCPNSMMGDKGRVEDLVIFSRTSDLLHWLVPKAEAFPRSFRQSVTARLLAAALDLPERLLEAQSRRGPQRRENLAQADATLNKLRLYLRLAHGWRWLSDGQYEHVSRMVAEIGKLLGGWIRQTSGKPASHPAISKFEASQSVAAQATPLLCMCPTPQGHADRMHPRHPAASTASRQP